MSTPPYVKEFDLGDIRVGTVVMDRSDFDKLVDDIRSSMADIPPEAFEAITKAGHIPLITRGTKTERFFQRYGIKCDKMGVMVRGHGRQVLMAAILGLEADAD